MKFNVCSQIVRGEEIPVNKKGCEEVEFNLSDVNVLSLDKDLRLVSLGKKGIFLKLTLKSWKALKNEFNKIGQLYRFDNSKR